ncbi:MAG: hypothetical protein P4M01_06600 [Acidobacteriota bacterium]|nr:hypothetical protein [Acidobacteriota bacterium]
MRKAGWIIVLLAAAAAIGTAQMASHAPMGGGGSQGVVPSSRPDFGAECGIQDTSVQASRRFVRGLDGQWLRTEAGQADPQHTGLGRLWHEHTWVADIHDASAPGMNVMQMHTGQMCFDPAGRILRMMDRYMDMPGCNCMRFTALSFDPATGRVTRREQHFLNATTGQEIAPPEKAKDFPEIWRYRRVDELPFFPQVNK